MNATPTPHTEPPSYVRPLATHHPFKVGDRIWERGIQWSDSHGEIIEGPRTRPDAIVRELLPYGFRYEYTRPVPFIARYGSWFEGGECYESGYDCWRLVTEDSPPEPALDGPPTMTVHNAPVAVAPQFYPFNINDDVRVKLTAAGQQALTKHLNQYADFGVRPLDPGDWSLPDKDGFVTVQLWDLMRVMGPAIRVGGPPLIESNIIHFPASIFSPLPS